jgi:O-antigen/teichoic acid export membrane protein
LYYFIGPAGVAIFSLANAVPQRAMGFLRSIGTLAMPKFAQRSHQEIAQNMPRKLIYFGLFVTFCCLAYVFMAPFLFKYILPKYLPAVGYSKILIFSTLSVITVPFNSLLFAHKKMKENYVLIISNLLTKAASLAIFVPIIGIWGAVIGTLTSSFSGIIISFYYLRKYQKAD